MSQIETSATSTETVTPSKTLREFCLDLISEFGQLIENGGRGNPRLVFDRSTVSDHLLANRFVSFFDVGYPLTRAQLEHLCEASDITVMASGTQGHRARGGNCSYQGKTFIYYKESDAPAAQVHSILHELFEVIERWLHEFTELRPRSHRIVERKANEFAARVQVPPTRIMEWINVNGIDVVGLRRKFDCSYATALIQLADVLSNTVNMATRSSLPMIGLLYERPIWRRSPTGRLPRLVLRYFVKTPGFPFNLRKTGLGRVSIHQNGRTCSLRRLAQSGSQLFLDQVEFQIDGRAYPVHIVVNTVRWRSVPLKPVKVVIQIMPADCRSLRTLAANYGLQPSELFEED